MTCRSRWVWLALMAGLLIAVVLASCGPPNPGHEELIIDLGRTITSQEAAMQAVKDNLAAISQPHLMRPPGEINQNTLRTISAGESQHNEELSFLVSLEYTSGTDEMGKVSVTVTRSGKIYGIVWNEP